MRARRRVVVVGGGISGLTAAWELGRRGFETTLVEASPRLGGKIADVTVAGVSVDAGAESVLARRPEAVELIDALGLKEARCAPATTSARIFTRGALRALPSGQVMGVPGNLRALAGSRVLSPLGALRAARDLIWPATPMRGDVSVADHVGTRMGREVVDRLVEPMLGGVYAGRAEELSLRATMPALAERAAGTRSLAAAAARVARPAAAAGAGPVFAGVRGGLGRVVAELSRHAGAQIRTGCTVRRLTRAPAGWRLEVAEHGARVESIAADGVVLACPPAAAARLLRAEAPRAAEPLADIRAASMAVLTLSYRAQDLPRPHGASGVLVPAREGLTVKAVTFSSVKWPWVADALHRADPRTPRVLLRCSIGRLGEEAVVQRGDEELLALAHADLVRLCGASAAPLEGRVTRWEAGLPQYSVGHGERIAAVREALRRQPALAVCGAAYDGVGIAACVATARTAAGDLAARLADPPQEADTMGETS